MTMYSLSRSLRRAALVNRNGVASRFEGNDTTWAETLERVQKIAAALVAAGVSDNDRVAMLGGNSDTYFQCLFAIPWAGGILVPINMRLAPPEIIHCLNDSGSRILLVDEEFLDIVPEIQRSSPSVELIICAGNGRDSLATPPLGELIESCEPIEDCGRGGSDITALYYTGGTTGRSKGVVITHEKIIVNILQWATAIGVSRTDVLLIIAPMFHLVGGLCAIASAVLAAGTCILSRFDVPEVVQTISESKVTKAALVPVMVDAIVNHLAKHPTDLSTLKKISYGGAPMTEAGLKRAMQALPATRFYQVYGQTEGGPNISILDPEYHVVDGEHAGKLRSAGQPIPGTEVTIHDEQNNPVRSGEVGEICVRGLTVSSGYWNLPEMTAEANRGGWLHTGDAGYFDEDGFLYIVDRIKDMIITGGLNVYSAEVENVLSTHPAVEQCVVFGIPSDRWGEKIHAIVRLMEGAEVTDQELMTHCRGQLAGYKCVRSVEFRTEPFPLSGANKVLKRELRAPYWEGRDRDV
jgi:long-chain acyl-CoA synthetase